MFSEVFEAPVAIDYVFADDQVAGEHVVERCIVLDQARHGSSRKSRKCIVGRGEDGEACPLRARERLNEGVATATWTMDRGASDGGGLTSSTALMTWMMPLEALTWASRDYHAILRRRGLGGGYRTGSRRPFVHVHEKQPVCAQPTPPALAGRCVGSAGAAAASAMRASERSILRGVCTFST